MLKTGTSERTHLFSEAYAVCRTRLFERGIRIRAITNHDTICQIVTALEKDYLTPDLDPQWNDFTPQSCVWLTAYKGTDLIGAVGCRFDNLTNMRTSSFWRSSFQRRHRQKDNPRPIKINKKIDELIHGRVVYMGDLVFKSYTGSFQDLGSFALATQMFVSLKWQPDFSYAFIRRKAGRIETRAHYGFMRTALRSHEWSSPKFPRSNNEICVYSSSLDLEMVAEDVLGEVSSME